jgi:adenylate cyclase
MGIEIERKFLVKSEGWRRSIVSKREIKQGYFARTPTLRARVRLLDDEGFITLKGEPGSSVRLEYEYKIPHIDAAEMIEHFSMEPTVNKTRYCVKHDGHTWSVDVFSGLNRGLVLAEVELNHPKQPVALPDWIGEEVTEDRRYGNSFLVRNPFTTWAAETRRADG